MHIDPPKLPAEPPKPVRVVSRARAPEATQMEGWRAPPLSQEFYAESYALRRSASSMHGVGMRWLGEQVASVAAATQNHDRALLR